MASTLNDSSSAVIKPVIQKASFSSGALGQQYPWTKLPLIVAAPMRLISSPALVHAVALAGGIGFLGAGIPGSDSSSSYLQVLISEVDSLFACSPHTPSPPSYGIGFLLIGDPSPIETTKVLSNLTSKYPPAAIWLFPAASPATISEWTSSLRSLSPAPKIWLQVGTVAQALSFATLCKPDVLVLQGTDAGGHGLATSASLMTLVPEIVDALHKAGFNIPVVAAGGVSDGRGAAAAMVLGADGVAMGTRFLATPEAWVAPGYQDAVLVASDGGVNTVRTRLYDQLRGSKEWPQGYNGRGVVNRSWEEREVMGIEENKGRYRSALAEGDQAWGVKGRATTYAGTGVGLVNGCKGAGEIVEEVREEAVRLLGG